MALCCLYRALLFVSCSAHRDHVPQSDRAGPGGRNQLAFTVQTDDLAVAQPRQHIGHVAVHSQEAALYALQRRDRCQQLGARGQPHHRVLVKRRRAVIVPRPMSQLLGVLELAWPTSAMHPCGQGEAAVSSKKPRRLIQDVSSSHQRPDSPVVSAASSTTPGPSLRSESASRYACSARSMADMSADQETMVRTKRRERPGLDPMDRCLEIVPTNKTPEMFPMAERQQDSRAGECATETTSLTRR